MTGVTSSSGKLMTNVTVEHVVAPHKPRVQESALRGFIGRTLQTKVPAAPHLTPMAASVVEGVGALGHLVDVIPGIGCSHCLTEIASRRSGC